MVENKLLTEIEELITIWLIRNYPIGSETLADLANQVLAKVREHEGIAQRQLQAVLIALDKEGE